MCFENTVAQKGYCTKVKDSNQFYVKINRMNLVELETRTVL